MFPVVDDNIPNIDEEQNGGKLVTNYEIPLLEAFLENVANYKPLFLNL